ncbi:MAG: bifunctional 4-hydroxy-2-oxoglutarate aldolase/2-dehydro-3-deoxy-phosphogluconate aldolase [Motilibacteraceae bacterium]
MIAAIESTRIVAILRATEPTRLVPAAAVLVEQGIEVLEFPLTTPGALDAVASARAALPSALVGAGTVLCAADAERAFQAGAQFVVSPTVAPDVIELAVHHGAAALPGAFTPTEALDCVRRGASHVKLFPAAATSPEFVRQVLAPLPDVRFVPTGGVGLEAAARWLAAGAVGVGVGSPLLGDALETGRFAELAERARRWRAALA